MKRWQFVGCPYDTPGECVDCITNKGPNGDTRCGGVWKEWTMKLTKAQWSAILGLVLALVVGLAAVFGITPPTP